ncbi:uncharacterized protein [Diabrotica undecimpunctata]|uniref:uncharacterized protein n=1 Tax=Diabrotica undecimpunctata TaxID=50387 RepID=UPI003B637155
MADLNIKIIKDIISEYIGEEKMIVNIEISKYGENYLSDIFKLDVKVRSKSGEKEDLDLVAKCSIHDKGLEMAQRTARLIKNEILCYDTIIPTLREFRMKYGFPDFDFITKYIASHCNLKEENLTESEAVLILENICAKGYIHVDRHIGYNLKQSKTILEEIAIFHATGLAMKQIDPELFEIKIKGIVLPRQPPPGDSSGPSAQLDLFRKLLEPYEEFKDPSKFNRYAEKIKQKILAGEFYNPKPVEPFATLIHSDIWCNNIMQVIDDEKIVKNKLLDFQLSTVGSPVRDLLFFLISSVKLEDLTSNFNQLIQYYHTILKNTLQDFKCYSEIFSYENFLLEMQKRAHETFLQCMYMLTNVIFCPKGKIFDHSTAHLVQVEDVHPIAKQKICFLMRQAAKNGWLEM